MIAALRKKPKAFLELFDMMNEQSLMEFNNDDDEAFDEED